jgi:peptidoglycan/xylan/chitin deacetylase (PgdA/CDA1 family)
LQLWETIRSLGADEIAAVMDTLRKWSGFEINEETPDKFPMTEKQLTDLSRNSLFTIGLHTANHVALDFQSAAVQEEELLKNKAALRQILHRDADIISFPYGRYNEDTLKLVAQHNLSASFTSEKKVVTKASHHGRMGRFAVGNWGAEKLQTKLDNWFKTR